MKYEINYLLAKLRGVFMKENWKSDVFIAQKNKSLIKELYMSQQWVPYRIDKDGTEFIAGN